MPPPPPEDRHRQLVLAGACIASLVGLAAQLYASPLYWKQEYHTSRLTGKAWVKELIYGHPDHIWTEFGVRLHVFMALVKELFALWP